MGENVDPKGRAEGSPSRLNIFISCLPGGEKGKKISRRAPAGVDSSANDPPSEAMRSLNIAGPRF
jgi:hypothetical protein